MDSFLDYANSEYFEHYYKDFYNFDNKKQFELIVILCDRYNISYDLLTEIIKKRINEINNIKLNKVSLEKINTENIEDNSVNEDIVKEFLESLNFNDDDLLINEQLIPKTEISQTKKEINTYKKYHIILSFNN